MNEIFLDIETTGLSFKDNHKVVEIACIETEELVPNKKVFHALINPERDVPEEAYKVHGYSTQFLKNKPIFKEIADDFLNFIKDKSLIIHNASFDIPFLNYELNMIKRDAIKNNKIIDSLDLARSKFPGSSNSLDALCKRFNIDLTRRSKHNAILDCELLREVYINLLDVKEPKLSFSSSAEKKLVKNSFVRYSKKVVDINDKEKHSHSLFLKNDLKKNYY